MTKIVVLDGISSKILENTFLRSRTKMKIFQVFNKYRCEFGGEPSVIEMTIRLLERHGNFSRFIMKSSSNIEKSFLKKFYAFFGGVYNFKSYYEMKRLLREDTPDVVHVHNLYPIFSPSVLVACRQEGIPVVMTVHNHILTCPNWFHFYKGNICEECLGGHEYRCVVRNCRGHILESIAYALRNNFARTFKLFHNNVTLFIVLTDFAKRKLMNAGFREDQIVIIPNAISIPEIDFNMHAGEYIAFVGRLSPEKGIDTLLSVALQFNQIPIWIAGDGPLFAEMSAKAPPNVKFVGKLNSTDLHEFYNNASFLIVPSRCFEQLGVVALEAMGHGLPVIASRIGGLPEVVDDEVTGLLFEPGNSEDLADKIKLLWESPELCQQLGKAGREKVIREYDENMYYERLMATYEQAIKIRINR